MIRNILSLVGLFIATSLIVVGKDIRVIFYFSRIKHKFNPVFL